MTYTQHCKENVCFILIFLDIYIHNTSKTVLDIQIQNWDVSSEYNNPQHNNVFHMLKFRIFFSFQKRKSGKDDKGNLKIKNKWWIHIKIDLVHGELTSLKLIYFVP